jgi:tRNA methyl transferase
LGNILTPEGKVVAQHQGLWQYTIGENARIPGRPKRLFVCSKNVEKNEVVVVDDPYVSCILGLAGSDSLCAEITRYCLTRPFIWNPSTGSGATIHHEGFGRKMAYKLM